MYNASVASSRGFPLNICGPAIRRCRISSEMSQAKLATALQLSGWDCTRETVAIIESQQLIIADFELIALAQVLNVALGKLLPPPGTPRTKK